MNVHANIRPLGFIAEQSVQDEIQAAAERLKTALIIIGIIVALAGVATLAKH